MREEGRELEVIGGGNRDGKNVEKEMGKEKEGKLWRERRDGEVQGETDCKHLTSKVFVTVSRK